MDKRLKLLQSGESVIKPGGGNKQKSHSSKAGASYNAGDDFVQDGGAPYKKQKKA